MHVEKPISTIPNFFAKSILSMHIIIHFYVLLQKSSHPSQIHKILYTYLKHAPCQRNCNCDHYQSHNQAACTRRRAVSRLSRSRGQRGFLNKNGSFETTPTEASPTEEIVRPWLSELKHISPAFCYILDESLIIAALITCFVHLQHIVHVLVKVENL